MHRSLTGVLFGFSLAICLAFSAQAQPELQPVFSSNSIDGTLIGLEGSYGFNFGLGVWKPFGGLAYGLESKKIRHKLGLQIGSISVARLDWPSGDVLGREGEKGVKLGFQRDGTRVSLFRGQLWQKDGTPPHVGYLHIASNRTFNLPYGISFTYSSSALLGIMMPMGKDSKDMKDMKEMMFQSMRRSLSLQVGQFSVSCSSGELENKAKLEDFEFVNSVRGYSELLKGEKFWKFNIARRFPLLTLPVNLPRPKLLPETVPWLTEIPVQGVLFFDGAASTHKEAAKDPETKNLFGWGFGIEVSTVWFQLRAKIIFDRDGKYTFDVGF